MTKTMTALAAASIAVAAAAAPSTAEAHCWGCAVAGRFGIPITELIGLARGCWSARDRFARRTGWTGAKIVTARPGERARAAGSCAFCRWHQRTLACPRAFEGGSVLQTVSKRLYPSIS